MARLWQGNGIALCEELIKKLSHWESFLIRQSRLSDLFDFVHIIAVIILMPLC